MTDTTRPFLTDRELTLARWIGDKFDELPDNARALNAIIAQAAGVLTIKADGEYQEVTAVERDFTDRVSRAAKAQNYTRTELGLVLLALAIARVRAAERA